MVKQNDKNGGKECDKVVDEHCEKLNDKNPKKFLVKANDKLRAIQSSRHVAIDS